MLFSNERMGNYSCFGINCVICFITKERKFVAIYNDVIGVGNSKGQKVEPINEYEIPVNRYKGWKYCIFRAMISPSEIVLYGVIIIGLIAFCCIV